MTASGFAVVGTRVLGSVLIVLGVAPLADLVETLVVHDSISAFDRARLIGWRGLAGGVYLVAGLVLVFQPARAVGAMREIGDEQPLDARGFGGVGLSLIGIFFVVRGLAAGMQVVNHLGGSSSHASIFGTIITGAAIELLVGALLVRSGMSMGTRLGRAGETPGAMSAMSVVLAGTVLAIIGAAALAKWFVFDVISSQSNLAVSPRYELAIEPGILLVLGALMVWGARASSTVASDVPATRV